MPVAPKINSVSFKRNNSGRIVGKPPEFPEVATMMHKLPKANAGSIKKPK